MAVIASHRQQSALTLPIDIHTSIKHHMDYALQTCLARPCGDTYRVEYLEFSPLVAGDNRIHEHFYNREMAILTRKAQTMQPFLKHIMMLQNVTSYYGG
jgi:hypothetical protein